MLLKALHQEAFHIILFLKSVQCLEVVEWQAGAASPVLQYTCRVQNASQQLQQSRGLFQRAAQAWAATGTGTSQAGIRLSGLHIISFEGVVEGQPGKLATTCLCVEAERYCFCKQDDRFVERLSDRETETRADNVTTLQTQGRHKATLFRSSVGRGKLLQLPGKPLPSFGRLSFPGALLLHPLKLVSCFAIGRCYCARLGLPTECHICSVSPSCH